MKEYNGIEESEGNIAESIRKKLEEHRKQKGQKSGRYNNKSRESIDYKKPGVYSQPAFPKPDTISEIIAPQKPKLTAKIVSEGHKPASYGPVPLVKPVPVKEKKRKVPLVILVIAIIVVLLGIIAIFIFMFYKPGLSKSERLLYIEAGLEKASVENEEIAYIRIDKNTDFNKISKLTIIFSTGEGVEFTYVPESFAFEYQISASQLGITDFRDILSVRASFEYVESPSQINGSSTVTNQTTNQTNQSKLGGGGGGGGGGGTTPPTVCAPEPIANTCQNFCGVIRKNNCGTDVNCNCANGSYCYAGEGIRDICIDNSINCSDSDTRNYFTKGNVTINGSLSKDYCDVNLTEFYCYYNGTDFEARNESYSCPDGCFEGACILPSCTHDDNCTGINLTRVETCTNVPDSNPFTWDYAPENFSSCVSNQCSAVTQTFTHTCNKTLCNAECDALNGCSETNCDNLTGCKGDDYYIYSNVSNNCLADCNCEIRTCDSFSVYPNYPTCVACTNDSGCGSEGLFCQGNRPYNCSYNLSLDTCFHRVNFTLCSTGWQCINGTGCEEIKQCNFDGDCNSLDDICSYGICNTSFKCEVKFNLSSTLCRASAGVCDVTEKCTGSSAACPVDAFNASVTLCRNNVSECDEQEFCLGDNATCPANTNKTDGTICSKGKCLTGKCVNCTSDSECSADGCYGTERRDYFCNLTNGCAYNNITKKENITNNNCNDGIDNDCDGKIDSSEAECLLSIPGDYVSYWKFEDNVKDENGINNGTLIGNPVYVTGIFGKGIKFDGEDDYISIPRNSGLEPQNISVGAWIKAGKLKDDSDIVTRLEQTNYASYVLTGNSSRYFSFSIEVGNYVVVKSPVVFIADGNWHYLVGTYDHKNVRFYFDGKEVGSGTSNNSDMYYRPVSDLSFGRGLTYDGNYFNGSIDEVIIYNRALSSQEIQQIYNAQKPPIPLDYVSYWKFENNANDETGRNNGVTVGNPVYVDGISGKGIKLDGIDDYISGLGINGLTNFSILACLKFDVFKDYNTLVNNNRFIGMYGAPNNWWKVYWGNSSGSVKSQDISSGITSTNSWNCIAFVYRVNGSNILIKYFKNGVNTANITSTEGFTAETINAIGAWGSGNNFNGTIDEMIIFNRSLSDQEVLEVYNAQKPVELPSLSLFARFLEWVRGLFS